MNIVLDGYAQRSRLAPSAIVLLPLLLAALVWFPDFVEQGNALWSTLLWCGGTLLLAQIGRDLGRRKQSDLYAAWGGPPTTRLLRHRDTPNKRTLARYHDKLRALLPDARLPTAEAEQHDPNGADEVYDSCVAYLREKTRDKTHFPLVYEENCNYGFRRNLWGMKPVGIVTTVLGGAVIVAHLVPVLLARGQLPMLDIASMAIDAGLLLFWSVWVTREWVKIGADAYAERLLATCEIL